MRFIDVRRGRPHALPVHPTKRWKTRDPTKLLGFVWHHSAGGDDPHKTAAYHVGGNHVSASGMPGLAYTFYIDKAGVIFWANDLSDRTWSQGGKKFGPDADGDGDVDRDDGLGDANGRYMGICFGGNFRSKWNDTDQNPTGPQMLAGLALLAHLTGEVQAPFWPEELFSSLAHLQMGDVWPHAAFGKAACPGAGLETLSGLLRDSRGATGKLAFRRTDIDWQRALVDACYDLGTWGPMCDGVDGDWGSDSKRALMEFQSDNGLPETGARDRATETVLFASSLPPG